MSGRARHSLSIVALAGIWLTMLLWGGNPLDRAIYEALYAGHRPLHRRVERTAVKPFQASSVVFGMALRSMLRRGAREQRNQGQRLHERDQNGCRQRHLPGTQRGLSNQPRLFRSALARAPARSRAALHPGRDAQIGL